MVAVGRQTVHRSLRVPDALRHVAPVEVVEAAVADAGDQLERRQRVAGGTATAGDRLLQRRVAHLEPGVGGHPAGVLDQRVGREEVELEVRRVTIHSLAMLGGGVIHDGYTVKGAAGMAGELGHVHIPTDGMLAEVQEARLEVDRQISDALGT